MNRKDRPRVLSSRRTPGDTLSVNVIPKRTRLGFAIVVPVRGSNVQKQVLLRLADRSVASMAHEQRKGAFFQTIDRADQTIQSAREEGASNPCSWRPSTGRLTKSANPSGRGLNETVQRSPVRNLSIFREARAAGSIVRDRTPARRYRVRVSTRPATTARD